jgi:hypothetical protein
MLARGYSGELPTARHTLAPYNPPYVETRSSSNSVHLPLGFYWMVFLMRFS